MTDGGALAPPGAADGGDGAEVGDDRIAGRASSGGAPRRQAGSGGLPPLTWLLAPLVVGLLAAGAFAGVRHAARPPAWCARIVPTLDAMDVVGAGSAGPQEVADLAEAVAAVDFDALVAELPTALRAELVGRDAPWARLVANAAALRPGGTLLQVVPLGLIGAFAALGDRRHPDCDVL